MSRATFSALVLAAMSGLGSGGCQVDAGAPPDFGGAGQGGSPIQGQAGTGTGGSPTGGQAGTGTATDAGAGADAAADDASVITDRRCPADSSIPQRTDFSKAGPLTAATMDVTFEDKSRPLPATAKQPGAPSRTLVTTIYYPSSGPAPFLLGPSPLATGGPFPMLMYSHGYSSNRAEGARVAKRLASYGYIVVLPDFPLTNLAANGGPDLVDTANQPGDVSFLIDQLLMLSHDSQHVLAGGVDEARIGALGLSLGGMTTLLVTFHPRFQDKRVKVAMPIAPVSKMLAYGFFHTREVPTMLVAGDLDAMLEYTKNARRSFELAAPNAILVTIAKGTHAAFGFDFVPGEIELLNALIAPAGTDPSNPDGLACGSAGKTLQTVGPEWVSALGDANDFIDASEWNLEVCARDEYTYPAMDAQEQEDIVLQAAVPFFNAHLGSTPELRQDGCRYLMYELPKHQSVTLLE